MRRQVRPPPVPVRRPEHEVDVGGPVRDREHPGPGKPALEPRTHDLEARGHPGHRPAHLLDGPGRIPRRQVRGEPDHELRLYPGRMGHRQADRRPVVMKGLAVERAEEGAVHPQHVHRGLRGGPDLEARDLAAGDLRDPLLHHVGLGLAGGALPFLDPDPVAAAARFPQPAREPGGARGRLGHSCVPPNREIMRPAGVRPAPRTAPPSRAAPAPLRPPRPPGRPPSR